MSLHSGVIRHALHGFIFVVLASFMTGIGHLIKAFRSYFDSALFLDIRSIAAIMPHIKITIFLSILPYNALRLKKRHRAKQIYIYSTNFSLYHLVRIHIYLRQQYWISAYELFSAWWASADDTPQKAWAIRRNAFMRQIATEVFTPMHKCILLKLCRLLKHFDILIGKIGDFVFDYAFYRISWWNINASSAWLCFFKIYASLILH